MYLNDFLIHYAYVQRKGNGDIPNFNTDNDDSSLRMEKVLSKTKSFGVMEEQRNLNLLFLEGKKLNQYDYVWSMYHIYGNEIYNFTNQQSRNVESHHKS